MWVMFIIAINNSSSAPGPMTTIPGFTTAKNCITEAKHIQSRKPNLDIMCIEAK